MLSLIIIFIGTFWEASMDIIGVKHNYDKSFWNRFAKRLDKGKWSRFGTRFWDNSIAWRNKWKEGDPSKGEHFLGSSTFLSTFVDGWHLCKFFWLMHLFVAVVMYQSITSWLILDVILLYAVFGAGHELYSRVLLRAKKRA